MPPGSHDAFVDQSNYANQIFRRYSDTIAAQFYGHTHSDNFAVGYSDYSDRSAATANGVAFIGGSLTPKSGNPVFRIYDVDPDTYEVMDFRTYTSEFTSSPASSGSLDNKRETDNVNRVQPTSTGRSFNVTRCGSSTTLRARVMREIRLCRGRKAPRSTLRSGTSSPIRLSATSKFVTPLAQRLLHLRLTVNCPQHRLPVFQLSLVARRGGLALRW